MTQPPPEDPEVEVVTFPFPFVETDEQKLRCFIAKYYLNAEIDGAIIIENMERIYSWVMEGKVPAKRNRPALVKNE